MSIQVDGQRVSIHARTAYPFEDTLRFEVETDSPIQFQLRVRRPGWATAFRGNLPELTEDGSWFVVDRLWSPGDVLVLDLDADIVSVPYANGEVAVQRGPLQFVQPIAHRERELKPYGLPGFHDAELLPIDLEWVARYPVLPDQDGLGLVVSRDPQADLDHPWDRPPVTLEGVERLVPLVVRDYGALASLPRLAMTQQHWTQPSTAPESTHEVARNLRRSTPDRPAPRE